jgi:hypothetical protein
LYARHISSSAHVKYGKIIPSLQDLKYVKSGIGVLGFYATQIYVPSSTATLKFATISRELLRI